MKITLFYPQFKTLSDKIDHIAGRVEALAGYIRDLREAQPKPASPKRKIYVEYRSGGETRIVIVEGVGFNSIQGRETSFVYGDNRDIVATFYDTICIRYATEKESAKQ